MVKSDSHISLETIRHALNHQEAAFFSPMATFSTECLRRSDETYAESEYRQAFSLDADRILHSRAYTRYIDKTQVFYLIPNDHITHRVLHVQLVSKIARTISRYLGLNTDLTEAIALGHDIGHTPFGHDGEQFLSEICQAKHIGHFCHSIQSIQFLDKVEKKGSGWNLSLQTLDGILCHDGEIHDQSIQPQKHKDFETLESEIRAKQADPDIRLIPMTLEGCVVRFSDTIAYIGRDIEDAIRLNLITRSDLPKESVKWLGNTNGTIVYRLVTDVIQNSFQKPYVAFSEAVSDALKRLKAFNLERIYLNPYVKRYSDKIQHLFEILFERYLTDIRKENHLSVIFTGFLDGMSETYLAAHQHEEIVRDFIAGMTDHYFLRQAPPMFEPLNHVRFKSET